MAFVLSRARHLLSQATSIGRLRRRHAEIRELRLTLQATLLNAVANQEEIERLSTMYGSLASRIAELETKLAKIKKTDSC